MSLRKIAFFLLCIIVLPGCSATKSLFKKKQREEVRTTQESGKNHSEEVIIVEDFIAEPEEEVIVPSKPRPAMKFTESEGSHVRLGGVLVIPFPSSGELVIDSKEVQEDGFCYPYPGNLISPYGWRGRSMHTGIDLKAIPNDTIRAAMPGVVRMSKLYSSYGNVIVIRHYNGLETLYSHNSRNLVEQNDVVEAGDPIALAGRTGRATTEHLHFEVRAGGDHIDPRLFVDTDRRALRDEKLYFYRRAGNLFAFHTPQTEEQLMASVKGVQPVPPPPVVTATQAKATQAAEYYRVKSGDTLSAIARKHGTTVRKLCQLNNISETSLLQINQRLQVR